ncbi:MAG: NosD domain-containing protein [Candidatus Micrarchaeota archaeon]
MARRLAAILFLLASVACSNAIWDQAFSGSQRNPSVATAAPLNMSYVMWQKTWSASSPVEAPSGKEFFTLDGSNCRWQKVDVACGSVKDSRACRLDRTPTGLVTAGGNVYSVTHKNYYYSYYLQELTDRLWFGEEYYLGEGSGATPMLAAEGNRVYVFFPRYNSIEIRAFDTVSKEFIWTATSSTIGNAPPVVSGNVLVFTRSGYLVALYKDSGVTAWQVPLHDTRFSPVQILSSGDKIFLGGIRGDVTHPPYIEQIAAYAADGSGRIWGPVNGSGYYMSENGGRLYTVSGPRGDFRPRALDSSSGQLVWVNSNIKCAYFSFYLQGQDEVVTECFPGDYNSPAFRVTRLSASNGSVIGQSAQLSNPSDGAGAAIAGGALVMTNYYGFTGVGGSQPAITRISVSPDPANVLVNASQQFTATCTNECGSNVACPPLEWSSTTGSVTQSGLFTAGATPSNGTVTARLGAVSGVAAVNVLESPDCTQQNPPCIPVYACGTLGAPGSYVLVRDVSSDYGTCFTITADNVHLDCAGFKAEYYNVGVRANNRRNVSVSNCNLSASANITYSYALDFVNVTGLTATANNLSLKSQTTGLNFSNINALAFVGNRVSGGRNSGLIYRSSGVNLTGNHFTGGQNGLHVSRVSSVTIDLNTFSDFTDYDSYALSGYDWGSTGRISRSSFANAGKAIVLALTTIDINNCSFLNNRIDVSSTLTSNITIFNALTGEPKVSIPCLCAPYGGNPPVYIYVDWHAVANLSNSTTGMPVDAAALVHDLQGAAAGGAQTGANGTAAFRLRQKTYRWTSCSVSWAYVTNQTPHRFDFTLGGRTEQWNTTVNRSGIFNFSWGTGTPVAPPPPPNASQVSSCTTFSSAGNYALARSVTAPGNAPCFEFAADNASLDCAGYSVSFPRIGANVSGRKGVRISNCRFTATNANYADPTVGLSTDHSRFNTFSNNAFAMKGGTGISSVWSADSLFSLNSVSGAQRGTSLSSSNRNVFQSNAFRSNAYGVSEWGGTGSNVFPNTTFFNHSSAIDCPSGPCITARSPSFTSNALDARLAFQSSMAFVNIRSASVRYSLDPAAWIGFDWDVEARFRYSNGSPATGYAAVYNVSGRPVENVILLANGTAPLTLREKMDNSGLMVLSTPHTFTYYLGPYAEAWNETVNRTGAFTFVLGTGSIIEPPDLPTPTPPPAAPTPTATPPGGGPDGNGNGNGEGGGNGTSGPDGTPTPEPTFDWADWNGGYIPPEIEAVWTRLNLGDVSAEDRLKVIRNLQSMGIDPDDEDAIRREYERLLKEKQARAGFDYMQYSWLAFVLLALIVGAAVYISARRAENPPGGVVQAGNAKDGVKAAPRFSAAEALRRLRERL